MSDLVAAVANDREHGASWLAREALRVAGQCAERSTATTPSDLAREVSACAVALIEARPGLAPVRFWIEWLLRDLGTAAETHLNAPELRAAVGTLVESLIAEGDRMARSTVEHAAARLAPESVVATASYSETVRGACRLGYQRGALRRVLVAESVASTGHGYGQKLATALRQDGIPVDVVADDVIVQRASEATVVWLGADAVFSDGSILNGTPSLDLAEAAHRAGRPVEIICESAKVDNWTIPERVVAPLGFDRIPAALISTVITERGDWRPDGGGEPARDQSATSPPMAAPATSAGVEAVGRRDDAAATLVARIAELLLARKETIAVAESAAGGRICDLLTDRPGSSTWFAGGLLVYSNASKQQIAGLSLDTLAEFGVVSVQTAEALAESVRKLFGTTWGIGETGVAGPQGGRRSTKPAGLAHLAVVGPNNSRQTIELNTGFDSRADNKWAFAIAALTLLVEELEKQR
ncbi:MAG: nicotinamide-nucleotide amidohydrolase family protein [Chloroflexota bacterium]